MPHRVLFISHDAHVAGAEMALYRYVSALDRGRFAPLVLLPRQGALGDLLTQQHIPCVYVPYFTTMVKELTDPIILKQITLLREAILTIAPDLILINTVTLPHAIIAALTTDIPIVVHIHEFIDKQQFALLPASTRLFEEIWLQFPETLVADSDWLAQRYTTLLHRELTVIPNFVAVPPPSSSPIGIPHIVMIASLDDANKRPDLFIAAAALIRLNNPTLSFRCTVYGSGKPATVQRLNQQLTHSCLEAVFTLHPRVDDVNTIYRSSTIVFVASEIEAFSLVVIEAGSHQRPVVATRCGGPEELIIDGETGFLIEVGDAPAAAERLTLLLQNPDLALRIGLAARSRVETHYAQHTVMPRYENLLEATIMNRSLNAVQRRIGNPIARYFMGLGA